MSTLHLESSCHGNHRGPARYTQALDRGHTPAAYACLGDQNMAGPKLTGEVIWHQSSYETIVMLVLIFFFASNLQTNKVLFNFLTVFSLTSCGLGVWHHIASCVGDCEQHNFRTLHYPLSSRMMLATNNSFRESHQSYPIYFVQSIISPIQ